MGSLWGCSFTLPVVCVFQVQCLSRQLLVSTCVKRFRDGVTNAAKKVASSTQVARAATQRRSSAPGGQVMSPLPRGGGTYTTWGGLCSAIRP